MPQGAVGVSVTQELLVAVPSRVGTGRLVGRRDPPLAGRAGVRTQGPAHGSAEVFEGGVGAERTWPWVSREGAEVTETDGQVRVWDGVATHSEALPAPLPGREASCWDWAPSAPASTLVLSSPQALQHQETEVYACIESEASSAPSARNRPSQVGRGWGSKPSRLLPSPSFSPAQWG